MHLPERNILLLGPLFDGALCERTFRRVTMANEFRAPRLEHLIDSDSFAQSFRAGVVGGDEDVPKLALIFSEMSGDRNGAAQISRIVIYFATYVEPHQISSAHDRVQMVVPGV